MTECRSLLTARLEAKDDLIIFVAFFMFVLAVQCWAGRQAKPQTPERAKQHNTNIAERFKRSLRLLKDCLNLNVLMLEKQLEA